MHLKRIEHLQKSGTRKSYLNSIQSLILSLNIVEQPQYKTLYLEKYRVLIQVSRLQANDSFRRIFFLKYLDNS